MNKRHVIVIEQKLHVIVNKKYGVAQMQIVVERQTHLHGMGICSEGRYGGVIHHLPLTDRQIIRKCQRSGARTSLSVTNTGQGSWDTRRREEEKKNLLQSCAKLIPNHRRQIRAPKS